MTFVDAETYCNTLSYALRESRLTYIASDEENDFAATLRYCHWMICKLLCHVGFVRISVVLFQYSIKYFQFLPDGCLHYQMWKHID